MPKKKTKRENSSGGVVFRRFPETTQYLLILDGHGNWGFPKGHVEGAERPLETARREIAEETGIDDLALRGDLDVIDWYFRARHVMIHKFCHLFLFESFGAAARPQTEEGITECCWYPLDTALGTLHYENSRAVLRKAADLVTLMGREEASVQDR